ncbi:MAG: FmdB family zinc ribbon protein [Streptosporangiaceae bacterium]
MPTYQYTCTDCGEPVEAVQKFTDASLTVCAACGGRLRKVFSPVGIVFKGSGFYRNDSRNGSGSAVKDKPSGDSSAKTPSTESASNGNGSNGSDSNGRGSADKSAAKKSEPASAPAKSSSSSEKVA